jgi:ABC-type enterochelin transport system permease subunit
MKKTFETELPEGYGKVLEIDAKDSKFALKLNLIGVIPLVIIVALAFILIRPFTRETIRENPLILPGLIGFFVVYIVYVILHELVHGAAYKAMTGRKLKFGFTGLVAFCGVPDIYVYRKTALISLLAPFTVFNIVFILLTVFLTDPWLRFLAVTLLASHISGCVGDLYDTFLLIFRYRDPKLLMNDTGPIQTFYEPK